MELKLFSLIKAASSSILLIVPYGIETDFLEALRHSEAAFNRTLWN